MAEAHELEHGYVGTEHLRREEKGSPPRHYGPQWAGQWAGGREPRPAR